MLLSKLLMMLIP